MIAHQSGHLGDLPVFVVRMDQQHSNACSGFKLAQMMGYAFIIHAAGIITRISRKNWAVVLGEACGVIS